MLWLRSRESVARHKNEGYGDNVDESLTAMGEDDESVSASSQQLMPLWMAMLPLVLVIAINAIFTYSVFPGMDWSFLKERYPDLDANKMTGLWALIIALVISCVVMLLMCIRRWAKLKDTINRGVLGAMLPIFNTASEVGYGSVIAILAGFAILRNAVLDISSNPLISEAVAMGALSGITGSSSGGMSIALQTLGGDYLQMANAAGISPDFLHRVAVMSSGVFDTLPQSGAIITLLSICKLTHRQSYLNIAAMTIVVPLIALAVVITLGTMFGSF